MRSHSLMLPNQVESRDVTMCDVRGPDINGIAPRTSAPTCATTQPLDTPWDLRARHTDCAHLIIHIARLAHITRITRILRCIDPEA